MPKTMHSINSTEHNLSFRLVLLSFRRACPRLSGIAGIFPACLSCFSRIIPACLSCFSRIPESFCCCFGDPTFAFFIFHFAIVEGDDRGHRGCGLKLIGLLQKRGCGMGLALEEQMRDLIRTFLGRRTVTGISQEPPRASNRPCGG